VTKKGTNLGQQETSRGHFRDRLGTKKGHICDNKRTVLGQKRADLGH